jgi:hypothetical protein
MEHAALRQSFGLWDQGECGVAAADYCRICALPPCLQRAGDRSCVPAADPEQDGARACRLLDREDARMKVVLIAMLLPAGYFLWRFVVMGDALMPVRCPPRRRRPLQPHRMH